uniref:Z9 C14 acylCoA desaturase n=1 Tax=Chauliognathus lugubris TaxID=1184608 RepID=K7PD45_9COLE|nr:Z9 C14 acylCoA desaturase [Chauliognathus lugubris]
MAPNSNDATGVLQETDDDVSSNQVLQQITKSEKSKLIIVWSNVMYFVILHVGALYGLWLLLTSAQIWTCLWVFAMYEFGEICITAGVHRLWSHRSYKAKWPLRLFHTMGQTLAFQDAVVDWARDHRVHHKYSETDADPHNAKRGFFFSHMGWLMCRKSKQVKEKGKEPDISDLYADPILRYQKKYYMLFMPLMCFAFPTVVPLYFWNESLKTAFFVNIFRYIFSLHATWLVNSAAHLYGEKPYNKHINPAENLAVSLIVNGERWHNYHHTFPWDYKAGEFGRYGTNLTTVFINAMAKIGLAYDLKFVPEDVVKRRVHKTGDGSHAVWGWGDKDQTVEEISKTIVAYNQS